MTIMPVARLHRVRWAVRAALALGVAASVAGNVLHAAGGGIVSQVIAAWSPLALLITVELISRVPVHRRLLAAVRWLATATIAGIAAWVSYWHMVGVAVRYGETGASPYLLPLSVDGLVVVASVCLVELGGQIRAAADSPADTGRVDQATRDVLAEVRPITREATTRLRTQQPLTRAAASADEPSVEDSSASQEDTTADSAADTADSRPDIAPVRVPRVSPETAARIEAAIAAAPTAGQEEIARAASVSVRHVRRYLSGQRTGRRMATA
jgi:Protein of unknown function (DUF2637).